MQTKKFLLDCIEYFGEDKQMVVAIEEMAELTQQLSKFIIDHKNKSRERVVEEFVDVEIMLNQISLIFDISDDEVLVAQVYKLERLKKYIQSRENGE